MSEIYLPQTEDEANFNKLVAGIDGIQPPSITEQLEYLDKIQAKHAFIRQSTGLTAKLIDTISETDIDKGLQIDLLMVPFQDGAQHGQQETAILRVSYTTEADAGKETHAAFVDVGNREDGVIRPTGLFEQQDAELVFAQLDELLGLKNDGFLPNLNSSASSISKSVPVADPVSQ